MLCIQTDRRILKEIQFLDTTILPRTLELYQKQFYQLPDIFSLPVRMGEFTVFPDLITKPYPMVSEMIMQVMEMYRIILFYRKVLLTDDRNGQHQMYYLLCPDKKIISLFRDFALKEISGESFQCTISLAFAESILRRNAHGIELLEIKSV